jgi:hypothetical protein
MEPTIGKLSYWKTYVGQTYVGENMGNLYGILDGFNRLMGFWMDKFWPESMIHQ